MLILRRLALYPFRTGLKHRSYSRKTVAKVNEDMKQIHQETLRYVSPDARIKVDSDICVKISPGDLYRYPNGDALVVELHGGPVKNCTASMEVEISDDEKDVEVNLRKIAQTTDFFCVLAVPIKASLNIISRHAALVRNTSGAELKISAAKKIITNNVRAMRIELKCSEGDINCKGLLLGKETVVETQNKGNIILDKPQGDNIICKSSEGNITTNCCYVESSKFETGTGRLDLKNVHKKTLVCVHQKGNLNMTGFHGNLNVIANDGEMNLQLSELIGENIIKTRNLTSSVINISDKIEKNTSIDVTLENADNQASITLDTTLEHMSSGLNENKQQFKFCLDKKNGNLLKVCSTSSLTLGKSSWMENVRLQMAESQKDTS